jgi:hypothetical protein
MSAERAVPSARSTHPVKLLVWAALTIAVLSAVALLVRGQRSEHEWEVRAEGAPGNAHVALVRDRNCDARPCQTLWIGASRETARQVASLAPGRERCDEIAWTPDGTRVAFLVNGYQLRVHEAATLAPAGQFSLIEPDGHPTTRIARGVTFSENGRAVTFDDCPRAHSGCRSGLVAVPR